MEPPLSAPSQSRHSDILSGLFSHCAARDHHLGLGSRSALHFVRGTICPIGQARRQKSFPKLMTR